MAYLKLVGRGFLTCSNCGFVFGQAPLDEDIDFCPECDAVIGDENDLSTMKGCIAEAMDIISKNRSMVDGDEYERLTAVIDGLYNAIESLEYYEGFRTLLDQRNLRLGKEIDGEWLRLKTSKISWMLRDDLPEDEDIEIEVESDDDAKST